MAFGLVANDWKKMLYFFELGEKIGTEEYYRVLRYHVLLFLRANYPDGAYCFMQDGAPCHDAKKNQDFCAKNFADVWPKDVWPPSCPDLYVLDYYVWGELERRACVVPHKNVDDLKTSIMKHWDEMSADHVIKACQGFRSWVDAAIGAEGGHIELRQIN